MIEAYLGSRERQCVLEIRDIVCALRPGHGAAAAFRSTVKAGQLVALIGANGAGKSTTLRAISGLVAAAFGHRSLFEGEDITGARPPRVLARGHRALPGRAARFPAHDGRGKSRHGRLSAHATRAEIAADRERIYAEFPRLAERREQAAGTLSGGEQQMLAIGRALMSRPRLIMFDEPSLGLAPNIVERTFAIIRGIRDAGTTVLLVEQNAFAALEMCDHAYLLEGGRVVLSGPYRSLRAPAG